MSERDRLGALLSTVVYPVGSQTVEDIADRLIAAGVVLMDEERLRQIATDMYNGGARMVGDLDVERLARALHVVYHDGKPGEPSPHDSVIYCDEDAAAIAAAYREEP